MVDALNSPIPNPGVSYQAFDKVATVTAFRMLYQGEWQPSQGDVLQVEIFEAGVGTPSSYVQQIVQLNFADIPRDWPTLSQRILVERVLKGELAQTSRDRFFIMKSGERVVGVTAYQIARQATADLASFGWVCTHPDFRERGISKFLTELAIEWFLQEGGVSLYLGTVNPVAHHIYARFGFQDYRGIVMRYVAPSHQSIDFDQHLFRPGNSMAVRPATWGDMTGVGALYSAPTPWFTKDYDEMLFSVPESDARRYISVPASLLMRAEEAHGQLWVLENEQQHIVGAASLKAMASALQKHIYHLDFLVHPDSISQAHKLLEAAIRAAHESGLSTLRAHVTPCDEDKRGLLMEAGFRERAILPGQLRRGEQVWDLTLLELAVTS
jgi:GNAT superfamily N-acetyltransferase